MSISLHNMGMETTADANLPHIVVLGAGFGGLTFCQRFPSHLARITLVDRQNHHLFQPLLYQVATAGLAGPDIAQPIRAILSRKPNLTVLMEEVLDFNLQEKKVVLNKTTLAYDYLVLALGGVTSYFGHPEWERFAPGLKSLDDALTIRRKTLLAFERAEAETNPERRKEMMTMVVVGGGPTGVELAGAFAELARTVLERDFDHIDPATARVILIEGSPRVLAHFDPELSASALRQLQKLGVEVRTNTAVKSIREGEVDLANEVLRAGTIIWAAGVSASPLTKKLGVETDRAGRLKVLPDLSLPDHPEVFAVGDLVTLVDAKGQNVPGVSPAAMQMGEFVAKTIASELKRSAVDYKSREPFVYWDKGSMATIGRSKAVAQIGCFKFGGYFAWLAWLGVHLMFLVGFRNKFSVFVQWVYSYFTYKRGARIITGVSE